MPTRRQLIQKITLNSTGGNITFSNIPQNYTDLKIVVSARYALSGIPSIRMRFNSDSGNNYKNRIIEGSGSTVLSTAESSANNIFIGNVPGSATTSNTFCNIESYIPNYSSSNNKSVLSKSVTENNATTAYIDHAAGLWSNTAAINSINIYLTDLAANSTFYLYGITHVPIIRGGEESVVDGYKIHTFKSTASLQVIEGGQVEYLVIAGGGGGGFGNNGYLSGGGGAGGYRSSVSGVPSGGGGLSEAPVSLNKGNYVIAVGAGGTGINNGSPSSLSDIVSSLGGGVGGSSSTYSINGASGGSGGGGHGSSGLGGSGTSGQGYAGGPGRAGAGGGQGGGAGNTGSVRAFNGLYSTISGSSIAYASGGIDYNALPGAPNTGNGGTGSGSTTPTYKFGGAGGSGIVIIRYPYDGN